MARGWFESSWRPYVPVAKRRHNAEKEVARLRKQGRVLTPIAIEGTKIAATFWGRAWCTNLESYSDYENRLPRGRSYVRNGSVLHLEILEGKVEAIVRGTRTYNVTIAIKTLSKPRWKAVVDGCSGEVTSLVELLQGRLPSGVMETVSCRERGLFPSPQEIRLECSCPDWATMCKHVAAVMYGVGARLDVQPELLFRLRAVDHTELVSTSAVSRAATTAKIRGRTLDAATLGGVFGIEIDDSAGPAPASASSAPPKTVAAKAAPKNAKTRVTLAELAALGVTMGELAELTAVGTIIPTRDGGVYRTTPAARATLMSRRPSLARAEERSGVDPLLEKNAARLPRRRARGAKTNPGAGDRAPDEL